MVPRRGFLLLATDERREQGGQIGPAAEESPPGSDVGPGAAGGCWARGGRRCRAGKREESRALIGGDAEVISQQQGDLAGWAALAVFELAQHGSREAQFVREFVLSHAERGAPPAEPVAK